MKLRRSLPCAALVLSVFGPLGCPEPAVEICGNGLDDDGNGLADCDEEICLQHPSCAFVGECPVDANIPLRDPSSAVPLEIGVPQEGHLCPARDTDGYRVTVEQPGSVIVVTLSMDTNITRLFLGYSIARVREDGSAEPTGIRAEDPDTSAGNIANFTTAHRLEEPGEYIVIVGDVEGRDDGFDNVNAYTIEVDLVPDPDANEPNNTPAQATPIAPGTTNGIIATAGDEDWYAIEAVGNARIIDLVITAPANSGIEHVATLFQPDGQTVLQTALLSSSGAAPNQVTTRLRKAVSGAAGAPFLLKIADGGPDGNLDAVLDPAIAGYTVTLDVIANPDPNEGAAGNESIETATAVSAGQTLTASLASFADRDVYRVTPPAGTAATAPRVLVVEVIFDGVLDATFKPQVQVIAANPEVSPPPACGATCGFCYDNRACAEPRLQRFVQVSPFRTAYPLRNTEPVFVFVNEFNDDNAQIEGGYTIRFDIVSDPDPGEQGDDFLIPNLQEAGFANNSELALQRDRSKQRARSLPLGMPPVCDEAAVTPEEREGCLDLIDVVNPVGGGFDTKTVDCSDPDVPGPITRTLTGRLSYEGDRDYFIFPDFPTRGYFGIRTVYSIDRPTPVELTIFVRGFNGNALAGSTLEAQQTGSCREEQGGQNACDPGSICVDRRCWTDGDSNPARVGNGSVTFGDDECVVSLPANFQRPVYIEVTDNGINDFDLDMTYTLTVTITCGCPAACDNDRDFCQDGL
jgi:hypothetical protein